MIARMLQMWQLTNLGSDLFDLKYRGQRGQHHSYTDVTVAPFLVYCPRKNYVSFFLEGEFHQLVACAHQLLAEE